MISKMFIGNDLPHELLFLGLLLLSKLAGPLMKVAIFLAKHVLVPLGITVAASAIDAGIKKNTWFWEYDFNNTK